MGRVAPLGFPRAARLTQPQQFQATLAQRALIRSDLFSVHMSRNDPAWRLGLVVPKRYLASAVRRNTVKRAWRDAFRRVRPVLESHEQRYDLVIRLRSKPQNTPLADFRKRCRDDAQALLDIVIKRLDQQTPNPTCAAS